MAQRFVVAGVQFNEVSLDAVRWTARYFAAGCDLVLAHAVYVPEPPAFMRGLYPPSSDLVDDATRGAEVRLRELALGLGAERVWPEVRVGAPDDVLTAVAGEYSAELVALGPGRHRPGVWRMLGTTAERIARRAPASVLLGRNVRDAAPQRILVALDESSLGPRVIARAAALAEQFGAKATVLHVLSPTLHGAPLAGPSTRQQERVASFRERTREWLCTQVAGTALADADLEICFGDPGFEIVAAARRRHADLVVVGRHGARSTSGHFLGSVVEFVLRQGNEAVYVVADPQTAETA